MRLKDGSVRIENLCDEIKSRLPQMDDAQKRSIGRELVITSGNDSTEHGPSSLHYKDRAIDTRTSDWFCNVSKMAEFLSFLYRIFPDNLFDLIFEGDHLHIEYDPK